MSELVNFLWWVNVSMLILLVLAWVTWFINNSHVPEMFQSRLRPSFVWMLFFSFSVFIGGLING